MGRETLHHLRDRLYQRGRSIAIWITHPTVQEVQDLIEDFTQDFGVTLPFEDAERILISHEEL